MADAHGFVDILGALVAIIVATKLCGELAQRVGQPAVLGELVAGVLLGGSVLGLISPSNEILQTFSELGVLVLLFEIGLHTDLRSLARVGNAAAVVGLVGVAVPFVLGYYTAHLLGLSTIASVVSGAALTATSIGISARVLSDLGQLATPEGQVVLGAAVLDDVVGLIILSVVSGLVSGTAVTVAGVALTTAVAVGFIIAALVLGSWFVPPIMNVIERARTTGALGLLALAFAFLLAWLAARAGSAMIIGAFAAGLVLHRTPQRHEIEHATTTIGFFFVPIFFAMVGAAVDLRSLANLHALTAGGALIAVGVLGKFVAGYAPWWFRGRKALVGVAMIPRGEVGLIFAQMGLSTGALDATMFSALTLMVMVTTFISPPLLGRMIATRPAPTGEDRPGDGGIDDLVFGSSPDEAEAATGDSPR